MLKRSLSKYCDNSATDKRSKLSESDISKEPAVKDEYVEIEEQQKESQCESKEAKKNDGDEGNVICLFVPLEDAIFNASENIRFVKIRRQLVDDLPGVNFMISDGYYLMKNSDDTEYVDIEDYKVRAKIDTLHNAVYDAPRVSLSDVTSSNLPLYRLDFHLL